MAFYNGVQDRDDQEILHLGGMFADCADPDIEVKVRMLNINYGKNAELLQACRPLHDYAFFVDRLRFHSAMTGDKEAAVALALADMPEDSVLRDFLREHKAEVSDMILTEYDEERERRLLFAQGVEEGEAKGEAKGRAEGEAKGEVRGLAVGIRSVMEKLNYSLDAAMAFLNLTEEQKEKLRPLFTA